MLETKVQNIRQDRSWRYLPALFCIRGCYSWYLVENSMLPVLSPKSVTSGGADPIPMYDTTTASSYRVFAVFIQVMGALNAKEDSQQVDGYLRS